MVASMGIEPILGDLWGLCDTEPPASYIGPPIYLRDSEEHLFKDSLQLSMLAVFRANLGLVSMLSNFNHSLPITDFHRAKTLFVEITYLLK